MTNPWLGNLLAILESLRIVSAVEFLLGGTSFRVSGGRAALAGAATAEQSGGVPSTTAPLIAEMADVLYTHCYCRRFSGAVVIDSSESEAPAIIDDKLIAALSSANVTRERWDAGWRIAQVHQGGVLMAEKRSQRRPLFPGEYVSEDGPGAMPRVGAVVRVFRARESLSLQPGIYHAFGETYAEPGSTVTTVRLYWNLEASTAPEVLARITDRFNFFSIPFRFKCVVVPRQMSRTDSAVLYFPKEYYPIASKLVRQTHECVRQQLRPSVPLFTRPLARGLALGEDPANGESFGQHRCRLLAEAAWQSHMAGDQSADAKLSRIATCFAKGGVDKDRWYLNEGSSDRYDVPGLTVSGGEVA